VKIINDMFFETSLERPISVANVGFSTIVRNLVNSLRKHKVISTFKKLINSLCRDLGRFKRVFILFLAKILEIRLVIQ
jgi:hypothetical protein